MRPFSTSTIWKLIDWLGDHTAIPKSWSIHLISFQCGFIDRIYSKSAFNIVRLWYRDTPSLFMNGLLFLQLRLPFWVGIQIRPFTKRYLQCGFGWKGNGRLALLLRIQTDESSAIGMDGPNYGQTTYMNDGNK